MVEWRQDLNGSVSSEAVSGGYDINGESIYVGRTHECGDLIPGKIVPSHGVLYVAYDGKEKAHRQYEYLLSPRYGILDWFSAYDGQIPSEAIKAGNTAGGETLYVGRTNHQGSQVIGKVHPSHRVLYIPFDGRELPFSRYEILVITYPDGPPLPRKF